MIRPMEPSAVGGNVNPPSPAPSSLHSAAPSSSQEFLAPRRPASLTWPVLALLGVWTALVAAALIWSIGRVDQMTLENAKLVARLSVEKDLLFRQWVAEHGGVYVPADSTTPPNQYLVDLPERDIRTPSGRRLTLMNPAYAMRQITELGARSSTVPDHLTSLDPINPRNAPEPWEAQALRSLEAGGQEITSVESAGGISFLRLIRPLRTEPSCLPCHARQGYKVGDLRGGISAAVPMAPLFGVASGHKSAELASCALLWLAGCAAIGLGRRRIRRRVEERDQAEQALRRAHDELEQRVAERTTELSVAIRLLREEIATRERVQGELEQQRVRAAQADRLYALGGMAAGLAHELNQPLMGIAATATDILLRLGEGRQLGSELLQEMMEDTVVQVDRMSEIIGHLLTFSRDREDQAPVRFRVRDAVLGGMRLTAAQLRVHGIAVRVIIPDDLPDVDGWPSRLEQALVSLIANARDALDDRRSQSPGEADGVDPGRCPTLEVRATSDPDGTSVRLSVSDNGGGIPEAVLPRIFEPFFTTREVGKGTGLGLAVCKGIADQHGGRIEVDNRPGEGVTFTIVLPASKAASDPRRDQPG